MKKMLKTTLALVLSFAMLLCFAACDNGDVAPSSNPSSNNSLGGNTNNGTNNNANTNNGNTTNNDATNNGATQTANTAEEVARKYYLADCSLNASDFVDCIADFQLAECAEELGCDFTNRNDLAKKLADYFAENRQKKQPDENLTIKNINDSMLASYTPEMILEIIETTYGFSVANSISDVTRFELDFGGRYREVTTVKENGIWRIFLGY